MIVGFTAGAAILIINSQIGPFLGLDLPRGASVIDNVSAALAQLSRIMPAAPLVAVVTIVAVLAWRPLTRWIPAMFAGVVIGAVAAWLLARYVPQWPSLSTVQALPSALPPLSTPDLSFDTLRVLFSATLVMTLLALTEAMAIARAVATKYGDKFDGNQEFIGQGLANLAGSFFSAYPASGSFNRSGVNLVSGARTPFAAICATLFLIAIPVLCCSAGALSAFCGDRGAAVSSGVGTDRFSRDPANLGRRAARALADARNIHRDRHAVARMGDSSRDHGGAAGATICCV